MTHMMDHATRPALDAHDRSRAAEYLIDGLTSAALHARLELRLPRQHLPEPVEGKQSIPEGYERLSGTALHERAESSLRIIQSRLDCSFPVQSPWRVAQISTWPAEVLVSIAYHSDLQERISLANSCHRIQVALHSEPSLWNRIVILDMGPENDRNLWLRARQIFSRAAHAAALHLSVSMYPDPNPLSIQWMVLGEFLKHGTRFSLMVLEQPLSLSNDSDGRPWRQERQLRDLLCDPSTALHLEQLLLGVNTAVQGNHWVLPPEFICGNNGRLKSCRLQQVSLIHEFPYPAFANLREFTYIGVYLSDPLHFTLVQNLILSMPKLEILGLSQLGFSWHGIPADTAPLQAPNLRLVCTENISNGVADLARLFVAVPVVQYWSNPHDAESLLDVWPDDDLELAMHVGQIHLQEYPKRKHTGDARSDARKKQSFQFSIWSVTTWTVQGTFDVQVALTDAHAHRVVSLSIHERQWETIFDKLPHLPRLSVLSIVLSTCTEARQIDHNSSGIFWSNMISGQPASGNDSKTRFLALKEINIHTGVHIWLPTHERRVCYTGLDAQSPCVCATGCTIALCDVADFIRRMPLKPGMRLERLALHGMTAVVDIDPGKALCDLLTIVGEVEGTCEAMPEIMRPSQLGSRFDEALSESSDIGMYDGSLLSPSVLPRQMLPSQEMFWDMFWRG